MTNKQKIKKLQRDETLRLLKKLWNRYPDLRLGQLLSNARTDIYYVPDSVLYRDLLEYKP